MSALSTTLDLGVLGERQVTVFYHVGKGFRGTYFEPPEPPVVTIMSVVMSGIDIADMLPEWMIGDIKDECIAEHGNQAAYAAESRADAMREESHHHG